MKKQFKISYKIAIGFGLLILLITTVFVLTSTTLSNAKETNKKISTIHSPAISNLKNLNEGILKSLSLVKQISYKQTKKDDPKRIELYKIIKTKIPNLLKILDSTNTYWSDEDKLNYKLLKKNTFELIESYWDILTIYPDFESYFNAQNEMAVYDLYLEGQPIIELPKDINSLLEKLMASQQNQLALATKDMNQNFNKLHSRFLWLMIITFIIGILIAFVVIRSITIPVYELKNVMEKLSEGIYPSEEIHNITDRQKNEIGEMASSVATLVNKLKITKEFTLAVGSGNFDINYEPLSEHDELGFSLIKMRNNLANSERKLEKQVVARTEEAVTERKKATTLYRNLTDSIDYAKRIQQSFLTSPKNITNLFPDAFVLYKPKDKVSGDFFWIKNFGDKRLVAAVDCTGHGVPGAFVSMVGNHVLNTVTKLFSKPAEILDILHVQSSELLRSGLDENKKMMDGMDIALCMINMNTYELEFSGAYNSLIIVRDNTYHELKADRFSIGSEQASQNTYTNHVFQLQRGDTIYLFSDGYADQFGGPKSKKYLIKRFREKLVDISQYDMKTQQHFLEDELVRWKGANEQTDDILVIGIRV